MASPAVESRTESNQTTDTTTHTVSRPAGVDGDLTIAVFSCDGNPTVTWPEDYTQFDSQLNLTNFGIYLAYHQEDGTEGTSFDIGTDASEKSASIVYTISGAEDPGTQVPEAEVTSVGTGSFNPDPPSISPTGGSKDYLFIAGACMNGEEADDDTWCTAAPTNYGNLLQKTTGTDGAVGTNCETATADRAATTDTEDPDTFTFAQEKVYVSFTIAVHPASAPAASISFDVGLIPIGF